jgi:hypothetical protein
VFALVQKYLQNSQFTSMVPHGCSPSFVWVGVLLVYLVHWDQLYESRLRVSLLFMRRLLATQILK